MNVKELRSNLNFTQQELADITGIPRDRIAKWEQGKGSPKGYDRQTLMVLFERAQEIDGLRMEMGATARAIPAVRFGTMIKKKREKEELSWEDLGSKFGVLPVSIQALERGLLDLADPEFTGIWEWVGVSDKEIKEATAKEEEISEKFSKVTTASDEKNDAQFHDFLIKNDTFFKNQYAVFNTQVLANLTALVNQQKDMEALLKTNLEHTNNIEVAQQDFFDYLKKEQSVSGEREIENRKRLDSVAERMRLFFEMLKIMERQNKARSSVLYEALKRIESKSSSFYSSEEKQKEQKYTEQYELEKKARAEDDKPPTVYVKGTTK